MRIIFFFFQSVERHRMKLLNPYNQSIQVSNGYTINQTSFTLNYLAKNSSFTQKKTLRGILFSQFVSLQHFNREEVNSHGLAFAVSHYCPVHFM